MSKSRSPLIEYIEEVLAVNLTNSINSNASDETYHFNEFVVNKFINASSDNKERDLDAEFYIKNSIELYTYLTSNISKETPHSYERKIYYRGVNKIRYKLVPSLYRRSGDKLEKYYFNEIQVRCPEHFKFLDNLEKLVYMQHYGCPTRLLDITLNPLVALYFSCLEDTNSEEGEDGVVYVFGIDGRDVLYAKSDRIQMLSKLAEFTDEEQRQLMSLAYMFFQKKGFPRKTNQRYQDVLVERFFHSVKRDNGAFERDIVPLDLLKPMIVQPNQANQRIIKQDGAFIISGLDTNEDDSHNKINQLVQKRIIIKNKDKKKILEELSVVGINKATLFPEVEYVADYLKKITH